MVICVRFFGHMLASRIETRHLQRYLLERRKDGIVNKTAKNELGFLRRAFNLARQQTPPLVARVPIFPTIKESPPRSGFFEHDEFLAMRAELPEHLKPVITFAYHTGCRKGEILNLCWDQVDLLTKVVRLNPVKPRMTKAASFPWPASF